MRCKSGDPMCQQRLKNLPFFGLKIHRFQPAEKKRMVGNNHIDMVFRSKLRVLFCQIQRYEHFVNRLFRTSCLHSRIVPFFRQHRRRPLFHQPDQVSCFNLHTISSNSFFLFSACFLFSALTALVVSAAIPFSVYPHFRISL